MPSGRMLRVNELLKREIGNLIERDIVPFHGTVMTVQSVETTADLRQAHVYVSVYGGKDEKDQCLRVLRRHRAQFQRHLGDRAALKYTPVLRFEIDERIEEGDRILSLIRELEAEDEDVDAPAPGTDPAPE